ncbi:hypothetical protein MT340_006710 [Staphylococcus sp. NRL 16/872]|uniref:hypothetical protein n=1 Tax=Staphylococcus sp. NRL 16/872 TaxID=2930131 RepID=UPI001FB51D39|nr:MULTISPECIES: hypothetical protein [unclassified Staphylococcus]MCJ1656281.1 hypothetical protein [Staphylococcus sp. NRL 21/187]MCJ1662040.1 hypothetical protein [Staphylococcus sp. NRL 18/288]MCJ1668101.1 hypothetical protein [Staphylococcus sp. NRL 19/737]WEN68301.1 hypothetical protein MT340_006710 [Staphylococcus sp. NRL 16/872]
MYRFKLKASILADSLFSFLIVIIITIIFIPLLSQLNFTITQQYEYLEMKQMMLTSINHYNNSQLSQGIKLGDYNIKVYKNSICNYKKNKKIKVCVKY